MVGQYEGRIDRCRRNLDLPAGTGAESVRTDQHPVKRPRWHLPLKALRRWRSMGSLSAGALLSYNLLEIRYLHKITKNKAPQVDLAGLSD